MTNLVGCYARQQVQTAITATVEHCRAALVVASLNSDRNRWWSGHVMSKAGRDVAGDAQELGKSGGGGGWAGGGERVMARYKLPRLQKNSGSFSALPVSLHRRAWFTSAFPFSAPVQPFTVPALPFTASSQCPCMAVPASRQPRGTASGVFWAYSVRTWGGEVLVGALRRLRVELDELFA